MTADFQARVRALFPMSAPSCTLEVVDIEVKDGVLQPTLRLIVRDDKGIRDIKEQQLYLIRERHWNDRGLAFLSGCAAAFAATDAEALDTLMPHDLFPTALLDVPDLTVEGFAAAMADPRARRIIDVRPDDRVLLATIGKAQAPSAVEPTLEARCEDAASFAVYGDWLAERGDPRGELIAVQLALETRAEDPALRAREAELLHVHAYAWLRGFAWAPEARATFRRGFLHAIAFQSPPAEPSYADGGWEIRELAALPATRFLQHVEIGPKGIWDDSPFEAIGEIGLPPSVTTVAITTGDYQEMGEIAQAWPGLGRVRKLRLESQALMLDGLELPALRDLELVTRGLTRANLASLRAAGLELERLVLWISDEGVDDCDVALDDLDWILAGGRGVRELGLCGRDPIAVLSRVLEAPIMRELRVLDVAGGYLDATGAEWLHEHAAAFAHLERLIVPASRELPAPIAPNVVADSRFIPVYE